MVELWRGELLRVSATSRSDGAFALIEPSDVRSGSRRLIARRIGFQPLRLELPRDTSGLTLTLVALPTVLPEARVEGSTPFARDPCSRAPSKAAHAIFARAASRYRDDTRWLDRIARYSHSMRLAHTVDRETLVGLPLRAGWTRNAGFYSGNRPLNNSAVPRNYSLDRLSALPFPVPDRTFTRGTAISWVYPRFHEWSAPSFVSQAFVDSMPKAIISNAQSIALAFCPRDRRLPYTMGEIELAADTTIVAIRWRFVVSKPGEETGGISYFDPPQSTSTKMHLLPRSAIVWVRVPNSDSYELTEYTYGQWYVAELGDSVRVVPP